MKVQGFVQEKIDEVLGGRDDGGCLCVRVCGCVRFLWMCE